MAVPLAVGNVIHGFARGAFGRDHYTCAKIEAAGLDWIVARDADGDLAFAAGEHTLRLLIEVRDEEECPSGEDCRLGDSRDSALGLTIPGGY